MLLKKSSRNWCAAYGCGNTPAGNPNLSFHAFPRNNEERLKVWVSAVKRKNWTPSKYAVLCSEHLKRDTFRRPPGVVGRALLKKDAIPTIFRSFPHYPQCLIVKRYTLVRIHHETTKLAANTDNKRSKLSMLLVFSEI